LTEQEFVENLVLEEVKAFEGGDVAEKEVPLDHSSAGAFLGPARTCFPSLYG